MKRASGKAGSRMASKHDKKKTSPESSRSNAERKKYSLKEESQGKNSQAGFPEQNSMHSPSPIDMNEWTISVP